MKYKSVFIIMVGLIAGLVFTNCGGPKKDDSAAHDQPYLTSTQEAIPPASRPQFEVDRTFQSQLTHILQNYLKVKDACVLSDAAKVKMEATAFRAVLKAVDTRMLNGPALNDWSNYSNNLDMALVEILATHDIEAQRTAFSSLSDNLYKSIKAYGLDTGTAYYDFCPMAFNNQGGFWLSDNKEIRNPYFGDKMLTCGRVTEEIKQ